MEGSGVFGLCGVLFACTKSFAAAGFSRFEIANRVDDAVDDNSGFPIVGRGEEFQWNLGCLGGPKIESREQRNLKRDTTRDRCLEVVDMRASGIVE